MNRRWYHMEPYIIRESRPSVDNPDLKMHFNVGLKCPHCGNQLPMIDPNQGGGCPKCGVLIIRYSSALLCTMVDGWGPTTYTIYYEDGSTDRFEGIDDKLQDCNFHIDRKGSAPHQVRADDGGIVWDSFMGYIADYQPPEKWEGRR